MRSCDVNWQLLAAIRVALRHSSPYTCGIFDFTVARPAALLDESRNKLSQLEEIGDPEQRAALA